MMIDYWICPKMINTKEIKKVVNICESNVSPIDDTRTPPPAGEQPTTKTSKVTCTRWGYLSEILGEAYANWQSVNQNGFGYNLYPILEKTLLNYNVYDSSNSGEYDFHIDSSFTGVNDIKLTAIINL